MRTKFLGVIASSAAAVVVSAQSFPKTDDPNRIIGAAESIDQRLRQGNNNHRRRTRGVESIVETTSSEADAIRSLSEHLQNNGENIISFPSSATEVTPDLKIIGGTISAQNRYPWIASLTYFGSHICGGSLVAKDMVLTAAHCAGYSSAIELGRYDRTTPFDKNNDSEKIEVAYEIKHPTWNPSTVDNDFMLIKLVEPSKYHSLITLNTDPNFPSIPGEQLTIMGWGDTNADPDVNEPSMQLLEVQLEYVPDGVCREKEGEVGSEGDFVKYESRLTENMMCAMDQDGGRGDVKVDEDTCLGDSGSPMIIPRNNEDVQVGIVSWGIGCASPTFPGVYSRVSSQYEWVRETVCAHSTSPPDGFGCEEKTGTDGTAGSGFPMPEEDENDPNKAYVTLEVSLDEQPEEFSWVVSTLSGKNSQLVATIPPGFYSGYSNYTFHHKLQVAPNQFYRISLRDTFGDGLKGYTAVYRGSFPILSNLIMYERLFYDQDRTDVKRIDHAFYTGKEIPMYFSLAIKFDKFPKDLWWKLESVTDQVILAQRPPGWYNDRFELMSIVEKIPAFGPRQDLPEYKFTIGDSYPCDGNPTEVCGDGICCNYGEGGYKLFSGDVEDNQLLSSGGDYGLSESVLLPPPSQSVAL